MTGVHSYVEALRSQSHEFMNKLHVILGMVQLKSYVQLEEYIQRIAHSRTEAVNFVSSRIKDTVVTGLILSKISRAEELGVNLQISEHCFMPQLSKAMEHEIVTVLGNLLDNAMEAVIEAEEKKVDLLIDSDDNDILMRVQDTGHGMDESIRMRVTERGFSTKEGNRGFGLYLVQNAVERLHGQLIFESLEKGTIVVAVLPLQEGE